MEKRVLCQADSQRALGLLRVLCLESVVTHEHGVVDLSNASWPLLGNAALLKNLPHDSGQRLAVEFATNDSSRLGCGLFGHSIESWLADHAAKTVDHAPFL